MSEEALLEPLKAYNFIYKDRFKARAEEYFDMLKDKSGLDVEANRETIKKLRKLQAERNALMNKIKRQKALKGLTIFFIVLFFVVIPLMVVLGPVKETIPLAPAIISMVLSVIMIVALIIVIIKILRPRISKLNDQIAEKNRFIAETTAEAERQMAPLNSLFDWNMPAIIFSDVIPLVQLDRYFDSKQHALMV